MVSGGAPRDTYNDRLSERRKRLDDVSRRRDRIGNVRLLVFLAGVVAAWRVFHGLPVWWIAAPLALFVFLVWWQSRVERDAECARRAIRFYERGIERLEHRWQGNGEGGDRFLDPHHPYAADFDLFGRASLFELLSTARTGGGEARLAGWLKSPSSIAELKARHAAVTELRPMLDLREKLAVLGDDYRSGVDPEQLTRWASQPPRPFEAWRRIAAFVFSLAGLSVVLWWLAAAFPDPRAQLSVIGVGVLGFLFTWPFRARILAIVNAVEDPARDLDLLSQILAALEDQQFEAPRLAELRKAIGVGTGPASRHIAGLRRLMDMLNSHDNILVRGIEPFVLWTMQTAMAVEDWRSRHGSHVPVWLDAVSEIEALSSLANYAWEHPEDPLPEFVDDGHPPHFEGDEMGHPLIDENRCVRNSVNLTPPLQLLVVSGSNMSGKSTLLRTIGVNVVLALAGAPVRAKRLRLSRLFVGASIRTMDSLEEGYSRFMAEILRLKQVLELPAPSLFLLDELLGGTNSHDRALGSEGLIRSLLERGAMGLITTHDLSLTRVATELDSRAANVHFEDRLEGDRLVFDYSMRPGVVERSNALDLMRAVGLNV